MINTLHARNYGCLLDVTAELTPLHAFIGPNDSGKSTILNAARTLAQLAAATFHKEPDGTVRPFDPFLPVRPPAPGNGTLPGDISLKASVPGGSYELLTEHQGFLERASLDGAEPITWHRPWSSKSLFPRGEPDLPLQIQRALAPARLVRFDPDALRSPSGLIPETHSIAFLDDRGHGLAGVYFAIRNRDDDAFSAIAGDVRRHFPTVRGLRVKAVTSSEVVLEAELTTGARVEARRMSEGFLYFLAFAALRHLDPAAVLLVEEPENGLHPARIAEVVRILRALVDEAGTQVLIATHSPLVVNELRPDEVSVVTRKPDTGTQVVRILDTPDFEERAKVYALGELWIAYANGEDEAPLLEGREP